MITDLKRRGLLESTLVVWCGEFGRTPDNGVRAGIAFGRTGKVRLCRRDELPDDWTPEDDTRVTVWEVTQHLVNRLTEGGGEQAAADLLRQSRQWADEARNLAYWLSQAAATKPQQPITIAIETTIDFARIGLISMNQGGSARIDPVTVFTR